MSNSEILVDMRQYIPCWGDLDAEDQSTIRRDIMARFTENRPFWGSFAAFLMNYIRTVETMLKRMESDDPQHIWTTWSEMLNSLDFPQSD